MAEDCQRPIRQLGHGILELTFHATVEEAGARIRSEGADEQEMRNSFLYSEVRGRQRIQKVNRTETAPRSGRFHRRAKGAHYLVYAEAGGSRSQAVEIDEMDLKLGMGRRPDQWPARKNNNTTERVVVQEQAKAFAADESGCTDQKN
jgi:hypothetical protein